MRTRIIFYVCTTLILLGAISTIQADVPQLINYQGVLLDSGGDPITSPVNVLFAVWDDPAAGDSLWSEGQTITPDANGLFNVLLGSVSPIPDSAFSNTEMYLSVKIDTDPEMTPRQQLTSVGYAYRAAAAAGGNWTLTDSVLNTNDFWGIMRGGAGNSATGDSSHTHVNLGVISRTGDYGEHWEYCTVGGGFNNDAGAKSSTVPGGHSNEATGDFSTVGGGYHNDAMHRFSTVSGGVSNEAGGEYSYVGGGYTNTAYGHWSVVPGGYTCDADGNHSFAAGYRAKAVHNGAFVWADRTDADFSSTASDQFLIRADGGVGIGTNNPAVPLHVEGGADANLTSGGYAIIGNTSSSHIVMDNNEIIARDNGLAANLSLNSGSGNVYLCYNGGNVGIGRLTTTNKLEVEGNASKTTAGSWLANSDARIKEDVRSIENALAVIDQLRPVEFKYTNEYRAKHPSVGDRTYVNYIAQEFRRVFPEDVKNSSEDGLLQIDTHPAFIYAVAAIQELHEKTQKIEELEDKVARLEAVVQQFLEEQR